VLLNGCVCCADDPHLRARVWQEGAAAGDAQESGDEILDIPLRSWPAPPAGVSSQERIDVCADVSQFKFDRFHCIKIDALFLPPLPTPSAGWLIFNTSTFFLTFRISNQKCFILNGLIMVDHYRVFKEVCLKA
jgi:hypothetical protein